MKRALLFIITLFLTLSIYPERIDFESLYKRFDTVIDNSQNNVARRESRILKIRSKLKRTNDIMIRYHLYFSLFDEYQSYKNDSAIAQLRNCMRIAKEIRKPSLVNDCLCVMALQSSKAGMYTESLTLLKNVKRQELDNKGLCDYQTVREREVERALRPKGFDSFAGQKQVLDNLEIFVRAAKERGEPLDHVLLHGPPGLGKTTLSHIIANELGVNMKMTSGPVLDKPGDLAGLLTSLEANDVLFIDEIHRLSPVVEEYLYSAMEDYKIDIMIESGPAARSVHLTLKPFTLIGATTRSGMLTAPLRARFGITSRLQYYDTSTLTQIVNRSAGLLEVKITSESALEIARRSRGTPRIANLLLRRVRDFAQVKGDGTITLDIARYALQALNVDRNGLDEMDIRILSTIIDKFKGGPVGLTTIATAVGEDSGTVEEVYEPYLIQEGYLMRTPRGREVTPMAYQHLGKIRLSGNQQELF